MALDLVGHIKQLEIPHLPDIQFKVRIGMHSGKLSIHLRLFHAQLVSQIFVLPSTGFEPTPLIHCSTIRLALRPAP
jgi:hypothetical protein